LTTSAVVTIVNDDPLPTVSYTPDPQIEFLVLEGGGSALITVTLSHPSVYTVTVPYSTTDSTATAPGDYLSTSGTLTFTPGVITQTFPVSIVDNLFDGPDKMVNLNLGAAVSATVGGDNPETLLIVDDDGPPQVYFSAPTLSVGETAGPAVIQVSLSSPSDLTVTVVVTATDGTASRLTDYDKPLTTTVTIAGGQLLTSAAFTVPITDDVIYEGPETINLALGVPVNAVSAAFNQTAVLTITDNEAQPTVKLSASSYTVSENTGSVVITATLSNASAVTATVNLVTSNGTGVGQAAAGADHTAVNTTLTFSPGVITRTFPITLTNDTFFEGNEVLAATLGSPISNTTLGAPSTATVTIVDDESLPTLALSASIYNVEEYAGSVVITATLTGSTAVTATANLASSNITATAPSDYTAVNQTLVFTPGVTSQTYNVPIVNDTTYEGNHETFRLTLSAPVSATVGSPGMATIAIFDDDPRPGCTIFNQTESPPLTITDDKPAGVDSTIVLSSPGVVITDVSVRIDRLWHPYVSDLRISLIPPTGPSVALVADPGVGGDQDNFFHTIFLGSASTPIGSGAAPFTGNFRPDQPLSTLNGVASGGTWTLHLVDASAGDVGTLEAWGLEICGGATAPTSYLYLPLVLR
jgi:subtilisin-like proprotein convertase family protein